MKTKVDTKTRVNIIGHISEVGVKILEDPSRFEDLSEILPASVSSAQSDVFFSDMYSVKDRIHNFSNCIYKFGKLDFTLAQSHY